MDTTQHLTKIGRSEQPLKLALFSRPRSTTRLICVSHTSTWSNTAEKLFSQEARAAYVEPDLAAIPKPRQG